MNGQRFHQQKRIEMKTEQCERGLTLTRALLAIHYLFFPRWKPCQFLDMLSQGKFYNHSLYFGVLAQVVLEERKRRLVANSSQLDNTAGWLDGFWYGRRHL